MPSACFRAVVSRRNGTTLAIFTSQAQRAGNNGA
jgi:hypothetical protein